MMKHLKKYEINSSKNHRARDVRGHHLTTRGHREKSQQCPQTETAKLDTRTRSGKVEDGGNGHDHLEHRAPKEQADAQKTPRGTFLHLRAAGLVENVTEFEKVSSILAEHRRPFTWQVIGPEANERRS